MDGRLKFSLRTVFFAVTFAAVLLYAGIAVCEFQRFKSAVNTSRSRLQLEQPPQLDALLSVIDSLSFGQRFESTIAFASYYGIPDQGYALTLDWLSLQSTADSIIFSTRTDQPFTCMIDFDLVYFDSGIHYNYPLSLRRLGIEDPTEVIEIQLANSGVPVGDAVAPIAWPWPPDSN